MLFTSATFVCFHLAVLLLRWVLPNRASGPLLLASSYAFYLSWGPLYGLLIFAMTAAGWAAGLGMERYPERKKLVLTVMVVGLLAVLAYFKYTNFLAAQWVELQRLWGGRPQPHRYDIVLPLGISFFTFEVLSYVVDVYRGEPAERRLWRFALYVAYYPHLIAGPIVRAHELLPNLRRQDRFDGERFSEGLWVMLAGYVKKMVLADNLAPFADEVFAHPERYSTMGVWVGVLAYTGQIYCDFSGYTDIARGASLTLGYPLPDNFDHPYLSRSITEFWRRWHMTLSRWLRDYLYISLGGNRVGRFNQYRNLFLTMLLGGLWHGASWTFVVWGAWHGLLLALHKLWSGVFDGIPLTKRLRGTLPYQAVAMASTLLLVVIGWVFFRATTFTLAAAVLRRMSSNVPGLGDLTLPGAPPETMQTALRCLGALCLWHLFGAFEVGTRSHRAVPPMARAVLWFACLALCYLFSESRATFIYFQF